MLSLRVSQTLVRRICAYANAKRPGRYCSWLVLAFAVAFAVGSEVTLARWENASERLGSQPLPNSAPFVASANFARLAPAAALRDFNADSVKSVPAASYEKIPLSPGSIVAAFGSQLATQTAFATDADPNTPGVQLPTLLGGTTVEVNGRRAGLFYVSRDQINYVMPEATEIGPANVIIKAGDGVTSNGTAQISQVSPAIFTANANGKGVPSALLFRLKTTGQQSYELLSQVSPVDNRVVITKPIDMGPVGEKVFLILYLSGVRRAAAGSVRVLIGGNERTPDFSGPSPDFVGLDQINVEIPRNLIGRGIVNVSVTAAGDATSNPVTSNLVEIEMAGGGGGGVSVSGFSEPQALAGQAMIITGSGFSPIAAENIVRIAGHDAEVTRATPTSLTVMVPFGVETGTVRVSTPSGEGISSSFLPVRTSISGLVEDTLRRPLAGVVISIPGTPNTKVTDAEGHFVLPDVGEGVKSVEVDGGAVGVNPAYPRVALKINAQRDRDNSFPRAISLQQSTGSGGTVGSGSSLGGDDGFGFSGIRKKLGSEPVSIKTDDFILEIQASTKATFPDNSMSGDIFLTPVQNARTPVELPPGFFSSSIVQITPFGVELDPGAKLIFPNRDGFPAGASAILFRYDQKEGKFVQDSAQAFVSVDGKSIETDQGAIKITTYYFAAVSRDLTTIRGKVFEKDGKTPVARALSRFRGQEALTDGAGSYVLRYVPIKEGEDVSVEVSTVRPNGRVDRVQSDKVPAMPGGVTGVPDVLMPATTANRPPTIIGPTKLEVEEGKTKEDKIVVTDPDANQTLQVKVTGPPFVRLVTGGSPTAIAYSLRLSPTIGQAGLYRVVVTATDSAGGVDNHGIDLRVKVANRAPTANNQIVIMDEDTSGAIKLEGSDPDGNRLTYTVVSQPLNGRLSGSAPDLTYTPNPNFAGTDRFTFKANDGSKDSNIATVTITVRQVNDPPVLAVPAAQIVGEGQTINLAISASDPDVGQKLTITSPNLPGGATLIQATATSAQFRWTPDFAQAGIYKIAFKVTDDGTPSLSDTKELHVVVNDIPLFAAPTPKKVNEGQPLAFDVVATIGLPSPVTFTATDMPAGASFQSPAINTLQFRWTPGFTQAGKYVVSIKATIGLQSPVSEVKQVEITVLDAQHDFAEDAADLTVIGLADGLSPSQGRGAGASVAIGDLDGDGIGDLTIGAPADDGIGQVHIFLGSANTKGTVDLAKKPANVTIRGEELGGLFGSSLAIGDINADGKADLIIGAPEADASSNAPDSGKVYVVFGGLAPGVYDIAKIANMTILGAARGDHLGASVAVGKIGGAAAPLGLIIGAPLFDSPGAAAPLADAGCVYGFFGGVALATTLDLGSSSADFTIVGVVANGQFGAALATGNFNADDSADIAIGAPAADFGALKAAGIVYLVPGSQSMKGVISASQASALLFNGVDSGDAAGSSVDLKDLNGDGRAELIIGAPEADGPNNLRPGSGEVYVLFGMEGFRERPSQLTIFGGSVNADEFPDGLGSSVAAGDFTGDGIPDLIMGAPGADPADSTRRPVGAAYMIFGGRDFTAGTVDLTSNAPNLKIFGAKPGDRLGNGGFAFGKLDLLGANDLAIGAPAASKGETTAGSASGAGEVRVLHGVIR